MRHAGTGTTLPTSGTTALYYHRNQQYSIVGLSDAAGALVERYAYTAYGELTILAPNRTLRATSSFQNRYTYTGRGQEKVSGLFSGGVSSDRMLRWEDQNVQTKRVGFITL